MTAKLTRPQAHHRRGPARRRRWQLRQLVVPVFGLALLCALIYLTPSEAKSISDDLKSSAGALEPTSDDGQKPPKFELTTLKPTPTLTTLRDIIDKLSSVFTARSEASAGSDPTFPLGTSAAAADARYAAERNSTATGEEIAATSPVPTLVVDRAANQGGNQSDPEEIAREAPAVTDEEEAGEPDEEKDPCNNLAGGADDHTKVLTDNQRLVNLQACMQGKVRRKLAGAARSSMELFERLSLSGSCTASLMSLMGNLGELKAYAFKFLDASAKVPSGMMYGLLSDFGDFDQCLSIRSEPHVAPRDEEQERAYSGKYCLLSVRLRYHVTLANVSQAPEGIYPDGVLWDELVRNYWTTNSSKGFQVGVCVPSRCNSDDLEQIFRLLGETYYFDGQVTSCQDSLDLERQQTPDWLQLAILHFFVLVIALNVAASLIVRYRSAPWLTWSSGRGKDGEGQEKATCDGRVAKTTTRFLLELASCFAIQRNWRIFLGADHKYNNNRSPGAPGSPLTAGGRSWRHLGAESPDESPTCSSSLSSEASQTDEMPEGEEDAATATGTGKVEVYRPQELGLPAGVMARKTTKMSRAMTQVHFSRSSNNDDDDDDADDAANRNLLSHLSGLKLLVILWITAGHSFLYPSANNYQYYRSIIRINITRDSVWFAATNFTLGIDMLLYMTGLLFVYKLGPLAQSHSRRGVRAHTQVARRSTGALTMVAQLIVRRILRFWPVYVAVISLAIVVPLASEGPMWPEMVSARLGSACRANWWANLLMINNFAPSESQVCLPSSWFVSVLMQCLLVGSLLVVLARRHSLRLALSLLVGILLASSGISFGLAYLNEVGAPAIKMDESFVMELDNKIFRMYTNTFNNLGPFLVGMLGGFLLLRWRRKSSSRAAKGTNDTLAARRAAASASPIMGLSADSLDAVEKRAAYRAAQAGCSGRRADAHAHPKADQRSWRDDQIERLSSWMFQLNLAFAMALVGALVLSSVFFAHYTRLWAALYWACHRVGWALVTGYAVHQCATGRWRLLKDLLSLEALQPLSRLIFISYLVFPIFIHAHSGLVRDGLHVSIYNMLNIYTSRLVATFALALALHLLVELPFCSLEELLLRRWHEAKLRRRQQPGGGGGGHQRPAAACDANGAKKCGAGGDDDAATGGMLLGESKAQIHPLLVSSVNSTVATPTAKVPREVEHENVSAHARGTAD